MGKRQQRGSLQENVQMHIEQLQRLKERTEKGLRAHRIVYPIKERLRETEDDIDETLRNLRACTSNSSEEEDTNTTQIFVTVRKGSEELDHFISGASEALNARLAS